MEAGFKWLVPVVFEVAVTPVQGPQSGGLGVVQAGDRKSGPIRTEVLAPGWAAFTDGQMPWGDVAFDTDLAAKVRWGLAGAPALDAGDVDVGKSSGAHRVMIAGQNLSATRV